MPNTLAHIGVQALVTRGAVAGAPPGWIWLGCILPDLPWIALRALRPFPVTPPVHDARLWAVVASSLLFAVLLAGVFAALSRRPGRTFAILALGALLHLLLDATQTKWGNGAILLAPFNWHPASFALYWPESPVTIALSLLGLAVFLGAVLLWRPAGGGAQGPGWRRGAIAGGAMGVWLVGTLAAMPLAEGANPHGIATLRDAAARGGQCVAFDRARIAAAPGAAPRLRIWTGEHLSLIAPPARQPSGSVSVEGCFLADGRYRIDRIHRHAGGWRDRLSYVGLALIAAWWIFAGWKTLRHRKLSAAHRSGGPARRP